MIAIFLPLAALAGYALASHGHDSAAPAPSSPPAGASPPMGHPGHGAPIVSAGAHGQVTPLGAVQACLRAGQAPPPQLAEWACAEAHALGRDDLAAQLYARYVAPFRGGSAQPSPPPGMPAMAPPPPVAMPPAAPQAAQAQAPAATAPQATAPRSPLAGIPDAAWAAFCDRLRRDAPTFQSQRRVGQYHQSRTRLAELGFDPEVLIGNAPAQDDALAADMAESLSRAQTIGLTGVIGQAVAVPEVAEAMPVSLSGLCGIFAVAGLDGAKGWLASDGDRRRFPHTTNVFMQTNGVF